MGAQNPGDNTFLEQMVSEVFLELHRANCSVNPKVIDLMAKNHFPNMQCVFVCLFGGWGVNHIIWFSLFIDLNYCKMLYCKTL